MTHRNRFGGLSGFVLFIAVTTLTPVSAENPQELADLAWIAGHWSGQTDEIVMEENWMAPSGGVMLGLHRDVRRGQPAFFEYLRITARDGRLVYVASPRGIGTTEFELVGLEGQRAIFENLEHDFPQRIIYSREDDRLTARVEGLVDGKMRSSVWVWDLVR